jgi:DNA-binding response OmpR family regulator
MYALIACDDPDETAILSLVLQRAGLTPTATGDLERALRGWEQRPAELIIVATRGGDAISTRPASPPPARAEPPPLRPTDAVATRSGEAASGRTAEGALARLEGAARNSAAETARRVRTVTEGPLLLVVNTVDEDTWCQALDAGADAVIVRPYSARLLAAQVRALLRRANRGAAPTAIPPLTVGTLTLDPSTRAVQVRGHPPRRLTHLEFRLLYTLMIHQGQTLPTETIVERVWGYSGEGSVELVRGLVSRLRAKVEEHPQNPQYILTVPGVGYSLLIPMAETSST